MNLLSAATTQTSIRFHYTAGLMPVLVVAAVLGAARLGAAARPRRCRWRRGGRGRARLELPPGPDPALALLPGRGAAAGATRPR